MLVEQSSGVTTVHPHAPVYRVVLWTRSTSPDPTMEAGYVADEYRVSDTSDVDEVLTWARARSREWAVYVELAAEGAGLAAARIAGVDPTEGEPFTVRAEL